MKEKDRKIFKEYYNNFVKEHDRSPNIEESFFDGNKILAQHIIELQKDKGNLIDELTKKADTNHSLVEQMAEQNERLELAKKIIKECLRNMQDDTGDMKPIIEQAEQFLKEN